MNATSPYLNRPCRSIAETVEELNEIPDFLRTDRREAIKPRWSEEVQARRVVAKIRREATEARRRGMAKRNARKAARKAARDEAKKSEVKRL